MARLGAAVVGALGLGCNSLFGIDDLAYRDPGGATSTTTGSAGAGGWAGAAGMGAGGVAGDAGAPTGGGGAGGASCVFGPFEPPEPIEELNTSYGEWDPAISADGLTIYWSSSRLGTLGGNDLWYATRSSVAGAFGTAENLDSVNTSFGELDPELAADGLALFFASDRTGGAGGLDLWYATRPSVGAAFGAAENLTAINTADEDRDPALAADGLTLVFASDHAGGGHGIHDIWQTRRASLGAPFDPPAIVASVSSAYDEANPALSPDGLMLVFSSSRSGGQGGTDLWTASRPSLTAAFDAAENLTVANSSYTDTDPTLSADGLSLYFVSSRLGASSGDIFRTTRSCE